ncbi:MAG: heavy-metal-associated domain-containing protein [Candidatus Cryptobacteroides sp.]
MKHTTLIIAACALIFAGTMPATAAAPLAEKTEQNVKKAAAKTVTFNVSMHCGNCVKKINENISFEKGVKNLEVSLDKKTVTVTYDPAKTDVTKLKAALEKLGYKVTAQAHQ